ncbi:hypothetical protein EDI_237900 [Entamoeba dispar SAW760]|uniref:SPRY domain-containing protein n=1 Tax=Entamoeba dispar (strain ATCC PRA-260 / SAW760) TaxID=370354 RepID=B0E8A1_ENTDS|nr:uncharacterized protein EDI_237900 [Entamoeba dispar SAW760]EDR29226.1 hypothetical protein EDI_237900 [Entamoeba dispar SAW760]|eukprot:EDR29226.1 hypothetical protein EDI_237900 [Entamoeba dispar SAW760]
MDTQELIVKPSEQQQVFNKNEQTNENQLLINKASLSLKTLFGISSSDVIDWNGIIPKSEEDVQFILNNIQQRIVFMDGKNQTTTFVSSQDSAEPLRNIKQMKLSGFVDLSKQYTLVCVEQNKYQLIKTDIQYCEFHIIGKDPIFSIGMVLSTLNKRFDNKSDRVVKLSSNDRKIFNEETKGNNTNTLFEDSDVIGCGYIPSQQIVFYTRNGNLINVIHTGYKMNCFVIELERYNTVNINTGNQPFVFDYIEFCNDFNTNTSFLKKTFIVNCELFIFEIKMSGITTLEQLKNKLLKIIIKRIHIQKPVHIETDIFECEEMFWNEGLIDEDEINHIYDIKNRITFKEECECSTIFSVLKTNSQIEMSFITHQQQEDQIVSEEVEWSDFCGFDKPVILIYDDTIKEKEEFCCHLELNDAIDIGATYPNPRIIKEDNTKKAYEWKGTYCSDGVSNCVIEINNKHFDYLFWEGVCLKKEEFKGKEVGITHENISNELEVLLKKLGMNEREINDFIVYWIAKLNKNYYKVTICDSSYDNEIAQLKISGFNQTHRIALKFEEVENINNLPTIDSVEERQRPTGKYVIEWGGIIA